MTLLYIKRYTRPYMRAHPDWLFIFGDNMLRHGKGGQAAEARDEPNAIGIATKRKPEWGPDAFFCDADYDNWLAAERHAMARIARAAKRGRTIIWPLDGLGTGRARLEKSAPAIWHTLEQFRLSIE